MVPLGKYKRSPGSRIASRIGSPISSWEKLPVRQEGRWGGKYIIDDVPKLFRL